MKKIVYIITSLDYGGTQKQLYYIVNSLKNSLKDFKNYKIQGLKEQVEPVIISLKKGGRYKDKFISVGVRVYSLNMSEEFNLLTLIFLPIYFLKFIFLILRETPFILHGFLFQANMFTIFMKLFLPKCKIILSERVAEKEKRLNLIISKFFYRLKFLYDKVLVNSEDLKKFVIENYGIEENKIILIPNIIDVKEIQTNFSSAKIRKELDLSQKDIMVLSVGRLHKQKGYDLLIEVAKILNEKWKELRIGKRVVFIIIGDGEEKNNLMQKVKKYNLLDIVKFIGYRENVYDYINACDIFLLTSLWEGSPNVILEALAFNKPVISTDVEGGRDILLGLENCFVVSLKEDKYKIAINIFEKIMYLSANIDSIRRKNNYSDAVKKFSIQNILPKFLDLYGL